MKMNKKAIILPIAAMAVIGMTSMAPFVHAEKNTSNTSTVQEQGINFADEKKDFLNMLDDELKFLKDLQKDSDLTEDVKKEVVQAVKETEKVRTAVSKAQNIDELEKNIEAFFGAENSLDGIEIDELNVLFSEEDMNFDDAYFDAIDNVISENDWENLTGRQIDGKLKKAGLEPLFDENDPFYNMTGKQIDALSDAEWEKIEKQHFQ